MTTIDKIRENAEYISKEYKEEEFNCFLTWLSSFVQEWEQEHPSLPQVAD